VAVESSLAASNPFSSRLPRALEADFLPGVALPATPDLQLTPDSTAKADALAAFSRAIVAEDNADADNALANYQKALALDPSYTELAVKVAFELTRRGDPSAGIQVLKDNIKASPKASLAYLYLSQLYSKNLNKPEAGLKYAQQALALDPLSVASYVAVYEIYITLNQPANAMQVLDHAAKSASQDPQFWLQLGDIYLKTPTQSAHRGPDSGLPSAADLVKKVNAVCLKVLPLAGNDPGTLAHIASFYVQLHQEQDAIPLYIRAIKYSPANAGDGDETLSVITETLARCFITVGRNDDAIATLKQLIKDDPLRYDPYTLLCDLYDKAGQTDAAIAVCQQMILLDQSNFQANLELAALQLKAQKPDAAIQTLTDARLKYPSEARITTFLGFALCEAKRYREATGIFEEALQEASDGETELLDSQFYFTYGVAAEQSGDVDKAATLLKQAIKLDPQNAAEAENYIGFMWVDRGIKLDEGGMLIRKALEAQPTNPAYIDSLGWYFFKKGDFKQAVLNLKKAASLIQPEDPEVDGHLADAYSASGDTADALTWWQKALALDKNNKDIPAKIASARGKLAHQGAPAPANQ
jgi:tetratricopeptide (TPR) repeat protein